MYEAEVAKGATWMDKHAPGWYKKIDLSELNLRDYGQCSLGQTLGLHVSRMLCNDVKFSFAHGFALQACKKTTRRLFGLLTRVESDNAENERRYGLLTSAWIQEILRRRTADRAQSEAIKAAGHAH